MDKQSLGELTRAYTAMLGRHSLPPEDLDPGALARHLPLLERLDAVESSSVAVYDFSTRTYAFLTSSFRFLLGYDQGEAKREGPDYFYPTMHPEDLPFVLDTVTRAMVFLDGLEAGRRRDFKLSFDYRMPGARGGWLHLVQQVLVLEEDRRGQIWLALIVNDLAGEDRGGPPGRQLVDLKDGSFHLFSQPGHGSGGEDPVLTRRELEILGLVAQGLGSKAIADRLSIALATVNNHRKSILEKTGAGSSAGAVAWASRLGLL